MGLIDYYQSPCENTWTGRHTSKCGHPLDAQPREKEPNYCKYGHYEEFNKNLPECINERNDGVMDMTYDQLAREPLFDDRDDDWDSETGTGEPEWVNL